VNPRLQSAAEGISGCLVSLFAAVTATQEHITWGMGILTAAVGLAVGVVTLRNQLRWGRRMQDKHDDLQH